MANLRVIRVLPGLALAWTLAHHEASAAKPKAKDAEARASSIPPTLSDVSYGAHARDVLDVWKAESAGPAPVLIYYHGGSFKAGDKSNVLTFPAFEPCLAAGITVVSANYRFSTDAPFPAPMLDGARAVQFVRAKAKEWNIDPGRVALSGGSAGGTMALWIALHDDLADRRSTDTVARESTRVQCVAARGAPSTIQPERIMELTGAKAMRGAILQLYGVATPEELDTPEMKERTAEASPLTHATKDDPPLFVIYHGRLSDAPFPEGASQKDWIHHVCLGMPLKEKYDALGLEFDLYSQDNPAPEGAELEFLKTHLLWRAMAGAAPESSPAAYRGPCDRVDGSKPPAVLFDLDFEHGFQAATASSEGTAPTNKNLPALVDGVRGQAAQFAEGQALRYPEPGHLNKPRGAVSLWARPAVDGVGEA
ncbi:MAG: alpha/beta hydrolase, partial [Candidatus Sumerlaeota bacterium]|nr:alpha/beta hydrolase [Candidatus Sumerlaeota bacterium]